MPKNAQKEEIVNKIGKYKELGDQGVVVKHYGKLRKNGNSLYALEIKNIQNIFF